MSLKITLLLLTMVVVAVLSNPLYEDAEVAASGDHHHGRVQIKVYRGPSEHHDHAPWGFWVKQPADDEGHH